MTNVLLITPSNVPFKHTLEWLVTSDEQSNTANNDFDAAYIKRKLDPKYPVGNLCIGAYIKKLHSDTNVDILDYNIVNLSYLFSDEDKNFTDFMNYGIKLISEKNKNFQTPDIIGISSLFSSTYIDMKATIDHFSNLYPEATIVAGGHLASSMNKDFLREFDGLDAVCYGEGEVPFEKLVEAHKQGDVAKYLHKDASWITSRKLATLMFEPSNTLLDDLDEIPPYELEMLLQYEEYFNSNDDVFSLGVDRTDNSKDLVMFATRGCPFRCIFCASQFVHGHKVRKYSMKRIQEDIHYYNKKYGITSFPFLDDHFLADKKFAVELMDFVADQGFSCRIFNLNYMHINEDIIRALIRTGSDRALITIDGLNQDFLRKVVRKPSSFKTARKVIQMFRNEGLVVLNNIIIGYPGETPEDIAKGVEDMRTMGANWHSILTAIPLPGSELHQICEDNNFLPDDESAFAIDYHTAVISTNDFSADWIKTKSYEINLDLNFVNNYDMSIGNYETALTLFERLLEKVIDTHAFAFYFAAICAKKLGDENKYDTYQKKYEEMVNKYSLWQNWAKHFDLQPLETVIMNNNFHPREYIHTNTGSETFV
ncbi:MAG: B12-binding domain-containing radical SAM protein [Gammaproteobacteria bacterium]|nr:B12-binding domain-containing radical SAM protein [Gammaproteobacteria bacterium]